MKRSGKPWLRSRLIVDRGLQFNLVTRMVIFVLFVFCVICAVLFSPLVRRLTGGQDPESRPNVRSFSCELNPSVCLLKQDGHGKVPPCVLPVK